jgi:hypothetical protein
MQRQPPMAKAEKNQRLAYKKKHKEVIKKTKSKKKILTQKKLKQQ